MPTPPMKEDLMTDQRPTLADWHDRRRAICAGFAAAGEDEERLLALARELVAWERQRPDGDPVVLWRVLDVRFDGLEFVHRLNHELLDALTDRQVARLLRILEDAHVLVGRRAPP